MTGLVRWVDYEAMVHCVLEWDALLYISYSRGQATPTQHSVSAELSSSHLSCRAKRGQPAAVLRVLAQKTQGVVPITVIVRRAEDHAFTYGTNARS